MAMLRRLPLLLGLLAPGVAQTATAPSRELAEVVAAYAAKVAASAIFVSGRTLDSVLAEEFAPERPLEALVRPLLRFTVDREAGTVTCRLANAVATAVHTPGLGCTLAVAPAVAAALRSRTVLDPSCLEPLGSGQPWPLGDLVPAAPATLDPEALAHALDAAFAPKQDAPPHRTRAVVVLHRGALVAERYGEGYGASTPLPGWSMTKSLTHALLGVRVRQGALDPARALPVPEWPTADARRAVRLDHLLTMTAGIGWREHTTDPTSDVARMLFGSFDHAAAFAGNPREHAPGSTFVYASGATNLLCRVLRTTFASDVDYHAFPRRELFRRLGMRTAVLETDASGTFVGSSYGFASARDWARLCLLYLNDGRLGELQLLPRDWVRSALTPTAASAGRHGQHVWTNAAPARPWPGLPANAFWFAGHEGQYAVALPDDQLVVVRLGCSKSGGFPMAELVAAIAAAIRR